jgi:hypothetical protein
MKLFSLALNKSNSEYITNIKKDSRERLRSRQQAWASSYSRDRRGARIVPPQTGGEGQKRGLPCTFRHTLHQLGSKQRPLMLATLTGTGEKNLMSYY